MKKSVVTKKPTQLIKQKPTQPVPVKQSPVPASSETPASIPVAVTSEAPALVHPEDVTLPSNATENVSASTMRCNAQ